ncbi:hypothetical protein CMV_027974, partial [Castanea mollissima]
FDQPLRSPCIILSGNSANVTGSFILFL